MPKTFRSTIATAIKEFSNADAAKENLGHSSVKATEGHYITASRAAPDLTAILESFNVLAQNHD